jgi:hypothetical protein
VTGSDRERDVAALRALLVALRYGSHTFTTHQLAERILASDWLAAYDKAVAAKALRSLRDHCDVRAGAPVAPGCPAAGDRQFWIRMAAAIDDYLNGSENA